MTEKKQETKQQFVQKRRYKFIIDTDIKRFEKKINDFSDSGWLPASIVVPYYNDNKLTFIQQMLRVIQPKMPLKKPEKTNS